MYGLLLRKADPPSRTEAGLIKLKLELWQITPREEVRDNITVYSGSPINQAFRLASMSPPRSYEPIPEGRYTLGDFDAENGVNWASGMEGLYTGSWGSGLGPVWVGIHPTTGLRTSREALGIHLDANVRTSPGSAGCIVVPDKQSLVHLVGWFKQNVWPRYLVVDWGLGSVTARFAPWKKG